MHILRLCMKYMNEKGIDLYFSKGLYKALKGLKFLNSNFTRVNTLSIFKID